jgi:hypothetical protein
MMSFAILYPLSSILSRSILSVAVEAEPRFVDYLPEDPFDFFRWWLGWIATIYATIISVQSLWGWYVWLAGSDKYISLLRRYLVVHGLRLRFRAFWGDVIICGLLCVAFLMLWRAHRLIYDLGDTLESVEHAQNVGQPPR